MNTQLFTLALLEILLSIVITVVIIFISFKMLKRLFFRKEDLGGSNLAFTIFTSGIVLSIGLILSEILPSITNVIRLSLNQTDSIDVLTIAKYSGIYLLIGFVMAVFINTAVFFLLSIINKGVDEFK